MQKPREAKRKADTVLQQTSCITSVSKVPQVVAWSDTTCNEVRFPNAKHLHNKRMRVFDSACTSRRVEQIGSSLIANSSTASGATRLDQLVRRVRARLDPVPPDIGSIS